MGRYIERDDPQAEQMFERLIGYSYAVDTYEETHKFTKGKGCQIQLGREPIEVESCQGYVRFEPMKFEGWVDVQLEEGSLHGRVVDIPPSLFGVPYSKVRFKYKAGELIIPQDIKDAVEEISSLMANPNVSTWNLPLSQSALLTITDLKKKHERG